MTTFEPAVRRWTNAAGQQRSSVHARQSEALKVLDDQGRTSLRLEWYKDELWLVDADNLLVNADAVGLHTLGILGFDARGTNHHEGAVTRGDFSPGALIDLVRAPEGANDPNAIGIAADGSAEVAGYVDRKVSLLLAAEMDAGTELDARSLRGAAAGEHNGLITVLIAPIDLMSHLSRNL